MKIRVTLKDPDTMLDSVDEAVKRLPKPADVSASEWAYIREQRGLEAKEHISDRWMRYGEYLDVEFDTEAGTATVLSAKD
jgi:hypothetical protein